MVKTSGASSRVDEAVDFRPGNPVAIIAHRRRPDPFVATYLDQIRRCPLLTREEESSLAHRMRKSSQLFRRLVLSNDRALNEAISLLESVANESTRFDRAINIGVRELQRKREMLTVIEQSLPQLRRWVKQNLRDRRAMNSEVASAVRQKLSQRIRTRTMKAVALVEQFEIRTQIRRAMVARFENALFGHLRTCAAHRADLPRVSGRKTSFGGPQCASRRFDRQTIQPFRAFVAGPDSGGQHWFDARRREIRCTSWSSVFDLCDMLDHANDSQGDRRKVA